MREGRHLYHQKDNELISPKVKMDKALLDLYSDYLISSFSYTTATGLSKLLEGSLSHDQITRFLSGKAQTSADWWLLVKPLARQIQTPDGVLIFDDSLEEKPYTDENEIVCWHWDQVKSVLSKALISSQDSIRVKMSHYPLPFN